ncbi:MAG: aminopeptidase N [Planktomarina sp.]|nr:aminopeptidase N [Planktomarina sp.]MDT2049959.1 aminopeptidase N [Planktomarina sp.]
MTNQDTQTIYLSDYQPPAFLVDHVELEFVLDPTCTRVLSTIKFRKNPESKITKFFLHGEELKFISAQINGVNVKPLHTEAGLSCEVPDTPFTWKAEVEINPSANTALSGLYMSNGMFCTQCEPEGFRRITYYPDRPDVMATFDVKIHSDLPYALSNGEPLGQTGNVTKWSDPWPKPSYLFALVSGTFEVFSDQFTTISGKLIDLNIYVRKGDEDKCAFAMKSLQSSMHWDEKNYNREYDLSVFNIVAVDDFNMGAMENKGLNIFNSSAVLASAKTSVDRNFESIEAIIAHEYFHNWTGNRITCRDWFQLSLKEGLTVFRDQEFSADMRGTDVRRIEDVKALRNRQFREDNGPLAHSVRPDSFVEINNFYTATVYEKGAELIRMLKALVGENSYKAALDLYFKRHDGQACTIEDWLQVFSDTTDESFDQFKLWYSQAGTPQIKVDQSFVDGTLTLKLSQSIPNTPGQKNKQPMVMPIALGLLNTDGSEALSTQMLTLDQMSQIFSFTGLKEKPILSILRGFSAPVTLKHVTTEAEQLVLLKHDTDMFNRCEASRNLGLESLIGMVLKGTSAKTVYIESLLQLIADENLSPAFRALCCALPNQDEIAKALADRQLIPDPIEIHKAHKAHSMQMAELGHNIFTKVYYCHTVKGDYSPSSADCGHRALANLALHYVTLLDNGDLAQQQFNNADNMTLQLPALSNLIKAGNGAQAITKFYKQWRNERLVIDKWFSLQVTSCDPDAAVSVAAALIKHPDFTLKNPNRFRALIGALAMTPAAFHQPDGSAYNLVANQLIALDDLNPQLCARMTTVFDTWKIYDKSRQIMINTALNRVAEKPNLSRDTSEILARLLNA